MFNTERTTTSYSSSSTKATYDLGLRQYMTNVYNFMAIALAISGFVAFFTANSPTLMQAIFGTPLKWVVMLAPLGFVIYFSAKVASMSTAAAKNCLWIFAGLMGISLSSLLVIYTGASITRVFFITASVFGAMSFYGYTTKKDLTAMGSFLFMGLIGIIIASLVNIFLKSSGLEFAISILGVLIFTGLTAYDVQKIKNLYYSTQDKDSISKLAVMGALNLYMDFINLFIFMLRFFGDRR